MFGVLIAIMYVCIYIYIILFINLNVTVIPQMMHFFHIAEAAW